MQAKQELINRYMSNPRALWEDNREKYPSNQIIQTEALIDANDSYEICYICGSQDDLLYIETINSDGIELPGIHCTDCSEIQEELGAMYLTQLSFVSDRHLPLDFDPIEEILEKYEFKTKKGIVAIIEKEDNSNKGRAEQFLLKKYPEIFSQPVNFILFYGRANEINLISDETYQQLMNQTKESNKSFREDLNRQIRQMGF